jgi:hypothetical protein
MVITDMVNIFFHHGGSLQHTLVKYVGEEEERRNIYDMGF